MPTPKRIGRPFRVYVGFVSTGYMDPKAVHQAVAEGIKFCVMRSGWDLPLKVRRTVLKPSVPLSGTQSSTNAYTHPEIVRATIAEFFKVAPASRVQIVEKAMSGHPTAQVLARAHGNSDLFRANGYYELEHLFPGRVFIAPADEAAPLRYLLSKDPLLRGAERMILEEAGESTDHVAIQDLWRKRLLNEVEAPAIFKDAEMTIFCPKLKTDSSSDGFSGAIRLAVDHDCRGILNDHRICDSLEVAYPQLVISDGIIVAAAGHRATGRGQELGAVLVSNNPLAHDWIAAQILNLDPMRIGHLRIAAERGWGPASPGEIEIGGNGAQGVELLTQKTRIWDLGTNDVSRFPDKFETENPGHTFPLEIISGTPYEKAGAHGILLEWLLFNHDQQRTRMARWPAATVCVGTVSHRPRSWVVYAIGERAISSLANQTSEARRLFRLGRIELLRAQFKNGPRYILIRVHDTSPGVPPEFSDLSTAFRIGSLGRMSAPGSGLAAACSRGLHRLRRRWRVLEHKDAGACITSRLAHNSWWALPSSSKVVQHGLAKKTEIPLPAR